MWSISVDEHALDLQEEAYEIRASFVKQVEKVLDNCLDDDELISCLTRFNCIYLEVWNEPIWRDHHLKTFVEFAQWELQFGNWQGLDGSKYARSWAMNWMEDWTGQQIVDICARRISQKENEHNKQKNDSALGGISFAEYLDAENRENIVKSREEIMQFLIETYTGKSPKDFAYMLYALDGLELIKPILGHNQTALHKALVTSFGNVGGRSTLHTNIQLLQRAEINEELQIKRHKLTINNFLTNH
ncbi:hypothetical protein DYU11_07185 [Fibrisoma montanum]|uniref:Uncharacterized protein n=1 Tax=Fibrisoma montanum TaxID=2305895 RepID=A0A418MEA2_9BACT|nr:hypothetical protein [Fibrisoma montanum]RIV25095.1 hypothetical protein DYU11_07185 [Fibrisoma montanum]